MCTVSFIPSPPSPSLSPSPSKTPPQTYPLPTLFFFLLLLPLSLLKIGESLTPLTLAPPSAKGRSQANFIASIKVSHISRKKEKDTRRGSPGQGIESHRIFENRARRHFPRDKGGDARDPLSWIPSPSGPPAAGGGELVWRCLHEPETKHTQPVCEATWGRCHGAAYLPRL